MMKNKGKQYENGKATFHKVNNRAVILQHNATSKLKNSSFCELSSTYHGKDGHKG